MLWTSPGDLYVVGAGEQLFTFDLGVLQRIDGEGGRHAFGPRTPIAGLSALGEDGLLSVHSNDDVTSLVYEAVDHDGTVLWAATTPLNEEARVLADQTVVLVERAVGTGLLLTRRSLTGLVVLDPLPGDAVPTSAVIVADLLLVGFADSSTSGGEIRVYDARTSAHRWTWVSPVGLPRVDGAFTIGDVLVVGLENELVELRIR